MEGLVTDIGGTNARLAIVEGLKLKVVKVYPTNQFTSALELFRHFQKDLGRQLPKIWAVGAAGVTSEEKIQGTNIGWDIVKSQLIQAFNLDICILLNDFEIAAYGLPTLADHQLVKICGGLPAKEQATKILLGAGTGLGEATCLYCPSGEQWLVVRSEGGHSSFAPTDETEVRLLFFLQKKFGHVSYERILSGQGLLNLHEFFTQETTPGKKSTFSSPSQVTKAALEGEPVSRRALELFCRIYGEEAGNFALKTLPKGGVFLSGGIALHIYPQLQQGQFRRGFESKGRMSKVLREFPVFVIKEPFLGLYGGAYRLLKAGMTKAA